MRLSEHDEQIFNALHSAGVFRDIDRLSLDVTDGLIHVFCGDCDERDDLEGHLRSLCQIQTQRPRIHSLALNGGPLLIPTESPLVRTDQGADRLLISQLRSSVALKRIKSVVFHGHAVCGAADKHGLSFIESVRLTVEAREKAKQLLPDLNGIELLFHVRHHDDRTRTHRVMPDAWISFNANGL